MNTDSYFSIGKSHTVCEDYAIAGKNYVIVSDGCSSSPDTDFGARLLAKACEREFLLRGAPISEEAIIHQADAVSRQIDLPGGCLDATLIVAYEDGNNINVKMFGDGAVIARKRETGEFICSTVEFEFNAPAYLSYLLDPKRTRFYYEKTNNGFRYRINHYKDRIVKNDAPYTAQLEPSVWHFSKDLFDLVMIASDGIESFVKTIVDDTTKQFEPIPVLDIVEQITNIKGFSGKFIERRVKKFLNKFCPDNGWHHNDDFSLAAIYLG